MSQSLLDEESSPPEDDKDARIHQQEKKVDTLNCELALLRQHMDSGFALIRSDMPLAVGWVGLTMGIVVLIAHMASRFF